MFKPRHLLAGAAVLAALAASAGSAAATTTLAALTSDRTLLIINADRSVVTRRVNVAVSGRLIGIDRRPADGQLYGVAVNGSVVVINPSTGQVRAKPRLAQTLPRGVRASVDFNPAVDRLRLVGSDGTNLRANVDDGSVLEDTDINYSVNPFNAATKPRTIGVAYSNSRAGTKATLLFNVDDASDALYLQLPANDGVLNPIGAPLGVSPGASFGFDIATSVGGENFPFAINGNRLLRPGLLSGRAFQGRVVQGLNVPIRDLAVLSLN